MCTETKRMWLKFKAASRGFYFIKFWNKLRKNLKCFWISAATLIRGFTACILVSSLVFVSYILCAEIFCLFQVNKVELQMLLLPMPRFLHLPRQLLKHRLKKIHRRGVKQQKRMRQPLQSKNLKAKRERS